MLTASCRDNGGRFEITLWGAGELGENIRIFINTFHPLFFCHKSVPISETQTASERKQLSMKSFDGKELDCLYFNTYAQMQQAAKRMKEAGYRVFESDVNPLDRYLMERMVSGSMTVSGEARRSGQSVINFTNPRLRGGTFTPKLKVLSIGADAGEDGTIYGITCADESQTRTFIAGNNPKNRVNADDDVCFCKDEKQLLANFLTHIKHSDSDIIIGWKVIDATLRIIQERCEKNGIRFDIGRESGSRIVSAERKRTWRDGYTSTKTVWHARVPGRVVMDVPAMLKAYYHDPNNYQPDFSDSLTNAKSVLGIFNQAEILPNAIERSRRSGRLLDSTGGSVAPFDHLYLPRLHRAGFAAGDIADIAQPSRALPGGHVLDPTPGLYENVLVFDFKSLYPSIIMTFMIDPLGFNINSDESISNPSGTFFSKDNSILPEIIRELMAARAQAVEQKNPYLSQAIKILMNSFYGVLGSTGCRFFSEDIASTITLTGQYILKASIEHIEKTNGKKVIYGDTDSIFVCLGEGMGDQADEIGTAISKETGNWLHRHLNERFGASSKLELNYEIHYNRFFIPSLRGGDIGQGAKKHYCGAQIGEDGAIELTFKGMESARSDWTDLAKEFQHELFIKLFSRQPLEDYVISIANQLQNGGFDEKLVYRKRMRKDIGSYTSNVPPHVQAAKQLDAPPRLIKYYITQNGPQPIEKLTSPLDYQHYIDSQLRPVADSILWWTGKDFDRLTSGQQDLFGE
ncbi:MAG: DNA polymerase II [Chitinispirillales bacterium]|nr:DNA polymerase II [Chitinispirillales bacterium]